MSKINEYPQAVTINNNDLFVIDQESGGDHATKSASVSQIADKATSGVQTQIGDLSALTTSDKSSLVGAVNEVVEKTIKTDELIVINSQQTTNADGNIDSNVFVSGGYSDSNYAVLSAVVVDNNNACVLVGNYNGRYVFSIKSRNDLSKIANFSVTIRIVLCQTPYLTA